MKGIKNFITGFSLSLISMSFIGQLYSPLSPQKQYSANNIKIDLFKTHDTSIPTTKISLLKTVSKHSIIHTVKAEESPISTNSIEGMEDDEILSVNVDGFIPIDYETTSPLQAEILHQENDNLAASLPYDVNYNDELLTENSPWEIAVGNTHTKNKNISSQLKEASDISALSNEIDDITDNGKEISYKVAEKIKQSIIFPIPAEILNDEDLTPTFIKGHRKTSAPLKAQSAPQKKTPLREATPKEITKPLKIVTKVPTQEAIKENDSKGLLDSLSSWFSQNAEKEEKKQKNKKAPSYSSQSAMNTERPSQPSSNEEFANFYETLQETTRNHQQNKILPSELKLSFQPNRAEISGQTLRWIKAFSEAAQNENTYLQVRLDASTPTDIQRKRLNLLYSIFINNGVNPQKIDTVFTTTEPNAFIIRSLTYH